MKIFLRRCIVLAVMLVCVAVGAGARAEVTEPLFSFVVVNDPHLVENRPGFPPGIDYFRLLMEALKTRPRKPAFVIITGDICLSIDPNARERDLAALRELIALFPVHITFGNNDRADARVILRKMFPSDLGEQDFYSFTHKDCRFVVICNAAAGDHVGHFCSQTINGSLKSNGNMQWDWLKEKLKRNEEVRRVFVFGHISPRIEGATARMNSMISPGDLVFLQDIIVQGKPDALFFGHLHAGRRFDFAGCPVYVGRSSHWNFDDEPAGFIEVSVYPGTFSVDEVDTPGAREMERLVKEKQFISEQSGVKK